MQYSSFIKTLNVNLNVINVVFDNMKLQTERQSGISAINFSLSCVVPTASEFAYVIQNEVHTIGITFIRIFKLRIAEM